MEQVGSETGIGSNYGEANHGGSASEPTFDRGEGAGAEILSRLDGLAMVVAAASETVRANDKDVGAIDEAMTRVWNALGDVHEVIDTRVAEAGGEGGGREDEAAAEATGQARDGANGDGKAPLEPPPSPFLAEVLAGLRNAETTAYEAGRQTLARTYEDLRTKAVANLEIAVAHAQLALAAMKWESENVSVVSDYLVQSERCLGEAGRAVTARAQLVLLDEQAQAARAVDQASNR